MTDQWVPAPPQPPGPPPPGLPPANAWSPTTPCAAPDSPSIANGVIITGRPAVVSAQPWQITVNDGGSPANFSIDHLDAAGVLIESPIFIEGSSGDVMLTHDPTQPLGVATKQYADNNPNYVDEAPINNTTYGRDNATWVPLPASYLPEAPNNTVRYGRFNSIWQADAIQTDAPNDGGAYARQSQGWAPAVTGGPYLPLAGGTMAGPLIMQGSNMIALNASLSAGQAAILGQKATITRWQLMLGDQTAEGAGNAGSNFALNAFSATGVMLGTWLSIARADGATTFNGAGLTIAGGLAVNGLLAITNVGNLSIPGGSNGQVLATNGSGGLSWATRLADAPSDGQFYTRQNAAWAIAPGGMTDAPNDGTAYARKSAGWAHLTHTDITDWTATLAPYALLTNVPPASTTPPLMDGTATPGSAAAFSRGDHVHPTDTSRAAVTALPAASAVVPMADGVGAVGVSTAYARADHVHPITAMNDNRIINGDMRIDQRNNGASGTAQNGYTIDRWQIGGSLAGKLGWGRNYGSIGAFAPGFPYCFGCSAQSTFTLAAGDYFRLGQMIEADVISDFAWGKAGAQPVTLSFWAYSSLTGTFSGSICNDTANRSYPFAYSIPAANTWTKIAVTIPGDTAGTWVMSGNNAGAALYFDLGTGATYRGSANAWSSNNYVGVTGAASVVTTTGAYFYLTGVKLEIGTVATPFNRQSLAKSMADCQRYYAANVILFSGNVTTGNNYYASMDLPVTMRAAPTLTGATVGGVASFPNAIGTFIYGGSQNVQEFRVANASGNGVFSSLVYASAEL